MQLVLSNNRVLAHGENFISMGGTVINTETNRVYQNATVAECDGCPSDIDTVGYEYHAGEFVPCAPYGKGNGNIAVVCSNDCKAIKDSGIPLEYTFTSSYMAFVESVNADTLDAAFGKNNEDLILGIGRQMAMYAWFKGTDKTENPFTNLCKISKLSDMTPVAFGELVGDAYLRNIVGASHYAYDTLVVPYYLEWGDNGANTAETKANAISILVSEEDLSRPFYLEYHLYNTYSFQGAKLELNGKVIAELTENDYIGKSDYIKNYSKVIKWSDLGVTSAGNYSLTGTSGYLADDNADLWRGVSNVTIWKMKG